jgi:thiamine pyrophosphokinase
MKLKQSMTLVCGRAEKKELEQIEGPFIGVDQGAYVLASLKMKMIASIGDFDSVTSKQMALIEQYSSVVKRLNPEKKETDTEVALEFALQQGYNHIVIIGGLGGRFDHTLANIFLLLRYYQEGFVIQDRHNRIQVLSKGVYTLQRQNYHYLSFFAFKKTVFSVSDVKYPVHQKQLMLGDVYAISNEITDTQAKLVITEGLLLVTQSNDS